MSLTIEDVQRWDPGAVRAVGDAARTRAQTSTDTANSLPRFPEWTGPGSEEAKQAIEKTRQALMKDARAALAAARSADAAAVNVQVVKDNLQQVLNMARDCGMVVDPVSGDVRPAVPGLARQNDWNNAKVLQDALKQVLAQADTVDLTVSRRNGPGRRRGRRATRSATDTVAAAGCQHRAGRPVVEVVEPEGPRAADRRASRRVGQSQRNSRGCARHDQPAGAHRRPQPDQRHRDAARR